MTVELREYHSFHLGEKRKERKNLQGKRPHYHRLTAWVDTHYRGGECSTCIEWVESKDIAKHPPMHRALPTASRVQPQIPVVPRLGDTA